MAKQVDRENPTPEQAACMDSLEPYRHEVICRFNHKTGRGPAIWIGRPQKRLVMVNGKWTWIDLTKN